MTTFAISTTNISITGKTWIYAWIFYTGPTCCF